MIVPDIQNGHMLNANKNENRWQTFIEACLIKQDDSGCKEAYLATPCRAEAVSPDSIFSPQFYEVVFAHTWEGTIVIRSGAAVYHPFRKKISAQKRYSKSNLEVCVHAPKVQVKVLEFQQLLATLQSEPQDRDNFLYMQVTWDSNNCSNQVICPCRYLNFPNPEITDQAYVQPISGNVLVQHNDRFYLAYVSCHVTPEGTQRAEFNLKDSISMLDLKVSSSGVLARGIRQLSQTITGTFPSFFLSDEYCRIIPVEAECTFFRYDLARRNPD